MAPARKSGCTACRSSWHTAPPEEHHLSVPYGLSTSINAQSFLGPVSGLVGLDGGSDMAPWRRQLFTYLSLEDEGETTKEDCKEEHAMGRKKHV